MARRLVACALTAMVALAVALAPGVAAQHHVPRNGPIAFSRDLYTMSSNGGGEQRITTAAADDSAPAYDPFGHGHRLAFLSDRDGDPDIYQLHLGGTGLRNFTHDHVREYAPAYS